MRVCVRLRVLGAQETEIVNVRSVEGADEQDAVVEPFSGLVSKKGRIFEPSLCMAKARRLQHSLGSWKPLLEIFMRQLERLLRCLRLRLGKIGVVALVKRAAVASDIQEEVAHL